MCKLDVHMNMYVLEALLRAHNVRARLEDERRGSLPPLL